mgnify:CR=1 FL=1
MEIVIENVQSDRMGEVVEFIEKEVTTVLSATMVKIGSEWVTMWEFPGGAHVDELRWVVTFHIDTLDDYAMNVLTNAFSGTGFDFFAPELGMRWTIA